MMGTSLKSPMSGTRTSWTLMRFSSGQHSDASVTGS
jgi:hypothetical protein